MYEMSRPVSGCPADLEHRRARVADRRDASAFVKELAELGRACAFRGMSEDANEPARNVPEFLVFAADRIAEAFELVRPSFIRMKVRPFDVNAAEVRVEFARGVLVAESLERGGHLFVCFGHDRGEKGCHTVFCMETEGYVVPFRIRTYKIVRLAAVVVNIDQSGRKDEIVAIDLAGFRREVAGRFVDPDRSDPMSLNQKRPFRDEVWESEACVREESCGGLVRHGES